MALFKRGVSGVRYSQPIRDEKGQRTKDWREALSREKELIAEAPGRLHGWLSRRRWSDTLPTARLM
jgi:hypothetical protein